MEFTRTKEKRQAQEHTEKRSGAGDEGRTSHMGHNGDNSSKPRAIEATHFIETKPKRMTKLKYEQYNENLKTSSKCPRKKSHLLYHSSTTASVNSIFNPRSQM